MGKRLPACLATEQGVIGAMIQIPGACAYAAHTLQREDFFDVRFGQMFEILASIEPDAEYETPSLAAIFTATAGTECSELVTSPSYGIITLPALEDACLVLKNLRTLRGVVQALMTSLAMSESNQPADVVLDEISRLVNGALEAREAKSATIRLDQAAEAVVKKLMGQEPDPGGRLRKTPLESMKGILPGFRGGQLVVLAGRPGEGKTAFGVQCAEAESKVEGGRALVFTGEMSPEELAERILSGKAGVDSRVIANRAQSPKQGVDVMMAANSIIGQQLYIADSSGWTIERLVRETRQQHRKQELSLVVVDYLQLLKSSMRGKLGGREEEIALISRTLKQLAREISAPVILLSQMNRSIEKRESGEPQLSDLRESGAIEQDADIVVFVSRDAENPTDSTFWVKKQRGGETGKISARFVKQYTRFEDVNQSSPSGWYRQEAAE